MSSTTHSRLDRIEAALVGTIGLLAGMQATFAVPQSWRSIVETEKNGLHQAMVDLIALKKESKQQEEAKVDGHSEQHSISANDDA